MRNQYTAFSEGAALLDLTTRETVLDVRGADAEDYLQRMLSCDLRQVTRTAGGGVGRPGTLMTGKGKLVAVFSVFRVAGDSGDLFRVVVERSALTPLRDALERLVILEEVEFAAPDVAVLSVQGPEADRILQGESAGGEPLPSEPLAHFPLELGDGQRGAVVLHPRSPAGGWDLLVPASRRQMLIDSLVAEGVIPVDEDEIDRQRILAGIPRFGVDGTTENLPLEAGYDGAIAEGKGCFAGQEVVARIRTYGHVNRRLCRIRCDSESLPSTDAEVRQVGEPNDEQGPVIGRVTSATRTPDGASSIALGFIRYRHAIIGTRLEIDGAGEAEIDLVIGG